MDTETIANIDSSIEMLGSEIAKIREESMSTHLPINTTASAN
jgi:hypothetical protein